MAHVFAPVHTIQLIGMRSSPLLRVYAAHICCYIFRFHSVLAIRRGPEHLLLQCSQHVDYDQEGKRGLHQEPRALCGAQETYPAVIHRSGELSHAILEPLHRVCLFAVFASRIRAAHDVDPIPAPNPFQGRPRR